MKGPKKPNAKPVRKHRAIRAPRLSDTEKTSPGNTLDSGEETGSRNLGLQERMTDFLAQYRTGAIRTAASALMALSLSKDADLMALVSELARFVAIAHSQNTRFRPIRNRDMRKQVKRWSNALGAVEETCVFSPAVEAYIAMEIARRRHPIKAEQYRAAVQTIADLRQLIDGLPQLKSGPRVNFVSLLAIQSLPDIYFRATGKDPGHKSSGNQGGPYYRFVKSVLGGIPLNTDTVVRTSVTQWEKKAPRVLSRTCISNPHLDFLKALAKSKARNPK